MKPSEKILRKLVDEIGALQNPETAIRSDNVICAEFSAVILRSYLEHWKWVRDWMKSEEISGMLYASFHQSVKLRFNMARIIFSILFPVEEKKLVDSEDEQSEIFVSKFIATAFFTYGANILKNESTIHPLKSQSDYRSHLIVPYSAFLHHTPFIQNGKLMQISPTYTNLISDTLRGLHKATTFEQFEIASQRMQNILQSPQDYEIINTTTQSTTEFQTILKKYLSVPPSTTSDTTVFTTTITLLLQTLSIPPKTTQTHLVHLSALSQLRAHLPYLPETLSTLVGLTLRLRESAAVNGLPDPPTTAIATALQTLVQTNPEVVRRDVGLCRGVKAWQLDVGKIVNGIGYEALVAARWVGDIGHLDEVLKILTDGSASMVRSSNLETNLSSDSSSLSGVMSELDSSSAEVSDQEWHRAACALLADAGIALNDLEPYPCEEAVRLFVNSFNPTLVHKVPSWFIDNVVMLCEAGECVGFWAAARLFGLCGSVGEVGGMVMLDLVRDCVCVFFDAIGDNWSHLDVGAVGWVIRLVSICGVRPKIAWDVVKKGVVWLEVVEAWTVGKLELRGEQFVKSVWFILVETLALATDVVRSDGDIPKSEIHEIVVMLLRVVPTGIFENNVFASIEVNEKRIRENVVIKKILGFRKEQMDEYYFNMIAVVVMTLMRNEMIRDDLVADGFIEYLIHSLEEKETPSFETILTIRCIRQLIVDSPLAKKTAQQKNLHSLLLIFLKIDLSIQEQLFIVLAIETIHCFHNLISSEETSAILKFRISSKLAERKTKHSPTFGIYVLRLFIKWAVDSKSDEFMNPVNNYIAMSMKFETGRSAILKSEICDFLVESLVSAIKVKNNTKIFRISVILQTISSLSATSKYIARLPDAIPSLITLLHKKLPSAVKVLFNLAALREKMAELVLKTKAWRL
ncbi:hypothetical protein HK096_003650 [Nowakowskiella sp. JEL0078]|nr:hypothetical protein HK096_003650 [Nowakowskiella sp. JEL0078]